MKSTPRRQTATQGKRSIYFPQFLIDLLGLDRLLEDRRSQSRRVTEVASRYMWLVNRQMETTLSLYSESELQYLTRIPEDLGWVEPENDNFDLPTVIRRALITTKPPADVDPGTLMEKITKMAPIDTVTLCEYIDRVVILKTDIIQRIPSEA